MSLLKILRSFNLHYFSYNYVKKIVYLYTRHFKCTKGNTEYPIRFIQIIYTNESGVCMFEPNFYFHHLFLCYWLSAYDQTFVRSKLPMSRLSCVQSCVFPISRLSCVQNCVFPISRLSCGQSWLCPDYRAFNDTYVLTFIGVSRPCNFEHTTPPFAFISVWTCRLSVSHLNLGVKSRKHKTHQSGSLYIGSRMLISQMLIWFFVVWRYGCWSNPQHNSKCGHGRGNAGCTWSRKTQWSRCLLVR